MSMRSMFEVIGYTTEGIVAVLFLLLLASLFLRINPAKFFRPLLSLTGNLAKAMFWTVRALVRAISSVIRSMVEASK